MVHGDLSQSFYDLTPDHFLRAVENAGLVPTGEYIQLNSYENRVFDVYLEKDRNPPELDDRIIAKFYRPHRWSQAAILEEHDFLTELKSQGIPAVAPWIQANGTTVSHLYDMYIALFPKAFARMPQELSNEQLRSVGRTLARIHNIGALKPALDRPTLNTETFGWPSLDILQDWVAEEVWDRYEKAAAEIFDFLDDELDESQFLRIHGDCHKGNLLMTDIAQQNSEFFFVDFDDFCNGPAAQDFWMLFSSSDDSETTDEQNAILEGYEELRQFDRQQLKLMPALRGLRIIHYSAWIARRWEDPNFPQLFPQFVDYSYWAQETEALERLNWALRSPTTT